MKSFIAILVIAFGSTSPMSAIQKTENYGYYESAVAESSPIKNETANGKLSESEMTTSPVKARVAKATEEQADKVTDETKKETKKKTKVTGIDHSEFDALLKAHVSSSGAVDYKSIKSKVAILDKYLGYLSQNVPASTESKNVILAFWINAYNANTIKLIVDNYPVASIMDLYGGKAFDKKWIKIGGETLSLNDIENTKIRAKFNEPRIHFAVNCAAKSCPPILNKAWTADNVEANLGARASAFVNDSSYNKLSSGSVQISKIFEWYAKDFPSDIVTYLNTFSKTKIDSGAKVSYIEYDWALNKK